MKFPVFFLLLAINGYVSAGLIPGVLCGVAGIACPTSTVALTGGVTTAGALTTTPTTAFPEETETICFDIPGGNIDVTIDPAHITQDQLDQVQQLLEDLVSNLQSPNDLFGDILGGLNGILNPGTTQAPGENGQLCLVLPVSKVDDLESFLNETLTAFSACAEQDIDDIVNGKNKFLDGLDEISALIQEAEACDSYACRAKSAVKVLEMLVDYSVILLDTFITSAKGIFQCLPSPVNP